jgi:hypothetical protein
MEEQAEQLSIAVSTRQVKRRRSLSRRQFLALGVALAAAPTVPLTADLRLEDREQRPIDDWSRMAVSPREGTLLGISFRLLQTQAFGLEVRPTLTKSLSE